MPTARRPILGHPIPITVDLLELGLIAEGVLVEALAVAQAHGSQVTLEGTQPSSTLEQSDIPLQYSITDGSEIATRLPLIMTLYRQAIPSFIADYIGLDIVPSRFEKSSITLNLLEGSGSRYEKHVDSNSITGLLFASSLTPEDGGALRLYYPGRAPLDVLPRAGTFLLYDARWVPHEVMPLCRNTSRLSLPMNYFLPTDIEERPAHLDDYIFGGDSSDQGASERQG